ARQGRHAGLPLHDRTVPAFRAGGQTRRSAPTRSHTSRFTRGRADTQVCPYTIARLTPHARQGRHAGLPLHDRTHHVSRAAGQTHRSAPTRSHASRLTRGRADTQVCPYTIAHITSHARQGRHTGLPLHDRTHHVSRLNRAQPRDELAQH